MRKILLSYLCLTVWSSIQVSGNSGESNTYKAAVVEYQPFIAKEENIRVSKNVENFVEWIETAKLRDVDIIVFPENGLMIDKMHSPIPDPADKVSPCDSPTFETTEAVRKLSCASKDNQIYSVVNFREKRACEKGEENCPARGYFLYNTNVAFDRKGVVIARYSKFNPYDEDVDKRQQAEIVYFDTDFGVRFGTFVCFDILFGEPALKLVQKYNVTNFVFTTYWFSELPFLTALQMQRGWAETNNVNLLASGVNNPSTASFGSGIYVGKHGQLLQIMPEKPMTQLLIADVPKAAATAISETFSKVVLLSDDRDATDSKVTFMRDQMELFQTEIIEPGRLFTKKICSGDFCCSFEVSVDLVQQDESKEYVPRAVVLDGVRKFGSSFRGGIQCCGVVVCDGPNVTNCTNRMKEIAGVFRFDEIKISGGFLSEDAFQIPSTLTGGEQLEPLSVDGYAFEKKKKGKNVDVSLTLVRPVTNLQTFAIWGRDFRRDSGAVGLLSTPLLLAAVVLFHLVRDSKFI